MLPLVTLLLLPRDALALHAGATSRPPAAGCRDAIPGEWCHSALVWARDKGARQHPDWFPGDAGQYTARDFQSLLHQVGSAQCPPPCPLGHAERRPPALGLLQTDAGKALNSQSHGFGGGELEEVMESTWAPRRARDMPAQASGPAAGALDADCEDASEGSLCHHSVTWLRESGFARHPEWYPGLSSDTSFEDVQMILHSLGKAECKKPCEHAPATYTAKQDDTDVLEVESTNGREMSGEEVVLAPPQSCGNTTTGDWCSISIQWLRDSGFGEHPDWYPGLSHESTDREVQAELHRQGKVGCPEPCQERRPDMTTTTSTVAPSCTDAEEGSACFDAVMAEIRRIKAAPDELASTFRKVQEHLNHSMKAGCTRPCPALHSKRVVNERGYMKKPVETMTVEELKAYFDGHWDGMVPASTQRNAQASTTEAAFSEDAAAEIESREVLTFDRAKSTAAENSAGLETLSPGQASSDENGMDTSVVSGPDDSNNTVEIEPSRSISAAEAGSDGEGLAGRIVKGSIVSQATHIAAENASDVEPRAPEQASSEENDIGDSNISVARRPSQEGSTAKAGRDGEGLEGKIPEGSTPNRATAAAAESATQEPLPYVGEDAAAASAADDQEATQETPQDATRQAPHDATQEGSVAGAAREANPQPGAPSGADDPKAELEELKAENDALKLSAELERLRAENQAPRLRTKPKAERVVYPEPMPMIATDEVLPPGEWEARTEGPAWVESREGGPEGAGTVLE